MKRLLLALLVGLCACGGEEGIPFPEPKGSLADYLPLRAGLRFVYRLDGDPLQSGVVTVEAAGEGLLFAELRSVDLRIGLLLRPLTDRVELLRFERDAVRIELSPALVILQAPFEVDKAYTSATRIRVLGNPIGINLLGVTRDFGSEEILERTYPQTFSVEVDVLADLLGAARIDLVLARDLGAVRIQVVSPTVAALGLDGVELKLELLEGT